MELRQVHIKIQGPDPSRHPRLLAVLLTSWISVILNPSWLQMLYLPPFDTPLSPVLHHPSLYVLVVSSTVVAISLHQFVWPCHDHCSAFHALNAC
eukprot:3941113-Rhodomonas_salina.2